MAVGLGDRGSGRPQIGTIVMLSNGINPMGSDLAPASPVGTLRPEAFRVAVAPHVDGVEIDGVDAIGR
jgi:hypothetical protein